MLCTVEFSAGASTRPCGLNSWLKGASAAIFSPTKAEIHCHIVSFFRSGHLTSYGSYQLCSSAEAQQRDPRLFTAATIVIGDFSLTLVDTTIQAFEPGAGTTKFTSRCRVFDRTAVGLGLFVNDRLGDVLETC